jgi:hypothetical protein
MFIKADKIKTEYKITYEYDVPEDSFIYNKVYEVVIKDCQSYFQAYNTWMETRQPGRLRDWYIDSVQSNHQDRVNEEVYQLVLAELFEGDIGVSVYVDDVDDIELEPELEGLEKILVEHQAQLKYDSKR